MTFDFYAENEAATSALAARIAASLAPGDTLLLRGDVGAGKSHFARAAIRALLGDDSGNVDIPSPTFTLVQTYETPQGDVWHCDLYRLGGPDEATELGLFEAFENSICLIEWPDRLGDALPQRRLEIEILQSAISEDARCISITPHGSDWDWVGTLPEDRDALTAAFLNDAGWGSATRNALAGDASKRRYERLTRDGQTTILMDAPPARNENTRPFVRIAALLAGWGFSTPEILASDTGNGFLLLEDLGDDLFARVVAKKPELERPLYELAIDLLVELQDHGPPDFLPPYSQGVYQREFGLLSEWYLDEPSMRGDLADALDLALGRLSQGDAVPILRDYHAENLIWLPERSGLARIGLLDFQDALAGHPAYDLVSLLEDARRDVSPDLRDAMMQRFASTRGIDPDVLAADFAILGAQRNGKILGLFNRLARRDGKLAYLDLIPHVEALMRNDLRHPAVREIAALLARANPEVFAT